MSKYIFQSERLGFRNWQSSDVHKMALINADEDVMEFFPMKETFEKTKNFIERMQKQFTDKGLCYFAVEELSSHEFIGFIGLSEQNYDADFTPCIDIGWRLDTKFWNKGFATEGAKRCLEFGFEDLKLEEIVSVAPKINQKSEAVMLKIGMTKVKEFKHPLLNLYPNLQHCVLYKMAK